MGNKMREIPKDIGKVIFGTGCPNNCWYCYAPQEITFQGFTEETLSEFDKWKINDMNILCYGNKYVLLDQIGGTGKYFEIVCGIDYQKLDLPTACLLRKYRFGRFDRKGKWHRYIRFAWDYSMGLQYQMLNVKEMLVQAGFKPTQIGIFMLVNGKDVTYNEFMEKLDTIKYWRCQVDDCCYDGGYPKDEAEFNDPSGRFEGKRYWSYDQIVDCRRKCRKHNQKVMRRGVDVEWQKKNI